jgi:Aldo/keto reductase family
MDDPLVQGIASKVGKTPAQVLIRWAVQRGTSVLPKSTNTGRIAANSAVWDWTLDTTDVAALSSVVYQQRMVNGGFLLSAQGPYVTLQDLWDEGQGEEHEELPVTEQTGVGGGDADGEGGGEGRGAGRDDKDDGGKGKGGWVGKMKGWLGGAQ